MAVVRFTSKNPTLSEVAVLMSEALHRPVTRDEVVAVARDVAVDGRVSGRVVSSVYFRLLGNR